MKVTQINTIPEIDYNGSIDATYYEEYYPEAQRLFNVYGENGLVMINRDLSALNRRYKAAKIAYEKADATIDVATKRVIMEHLAGQIRAHVMIMKELMQ